jgi:hypothetical protein
MIYAVVVLSMAVLAMVVALVQQRVDHEKHLAEKDRNYTERIGEMDRMYEVLIGSETKAAKADLQVSIYRKSVRDDGWLVKNSKSLALVVVKDQGSVRDVVGDIEYLSMFEIPAELKQALTAALVGAVKTGIAGLPV